MMLVAPVRERGLKFDVTVPTDTIRHSRSREGAWIEIVQHLFSQVPTAVAPVRERGLKFSPRVMLLNIASSRSREGAWIEIITCEYRRACCEKSLP